MTNSEAIEQIKDILNDIPNDKCVDWINALNMAIKALEQTSALDKVRAEIESDWQLKKYPSSPFSCGLRRAIEIIDKHKAESED